MRLHWVALLAIVGAMSVGCQVAGPTVRGQSPCGTRSCGTNNGPRLAPQYYDGPAGYGPGGPGQSGGCPPHHCHPNGAECPLCAPDNFHAPEHHHTFSYRQPKNLVYPPQNQPAGVVVYPYYTCKGPSDFFLK